MAIMKTKWIEMHLKLGLREIAACLANAEFTEEKGLGFEILELSENRIEARFTEKYIQHEIIEGPFGDVRPLESVRYRIFRFFVVRASQFRYYLIIINSPRSVRGFTSALTREMGGGVSFTEVRFDVHSFLTDLKESDFVADLKIKKLKASGSILNGRAAVRVEIQSRTDADEDLRVAFPELEVKIERVSFQFYSNGVMEVSDISFTGMLSFSEYLCSAFVDLTMKSLNRLAS